MRSPVRVQVQTTDAPPPLPYQRSTSVSDLPVQTIVVVTPIKELDLFKGAWALVVTLNGRVHREEGVQSSGTWTSKKFIQVIIICTCHLAKLT